MAQTLAAAAARWGASALLTGEDQPLASNDPHHPPTAPAAFVLLPEETPDSPDLESCWASYVSGDSTLLDLSREHGVSYPVLVKMAAKEGWKRQRTALYVARFGRMSRAA